MKIGLVFVAAGLTAGLPGLLPAAGRSAVAFPADAAGILKVLQTQASQAATAAGELSSISRFNNSSLQTQSLQLENLKNDVNSMALTLAHLQGARNTADATERTAADRATRLLKEMADNTSAAIGMLNRDGSSFWRPDYQHHIENVESASRRLAGSLKEVVQLANVRAREKRLEKSLSTETGS